MSESSSPHIAHIISRSCASCFFQQEMSLMARKSWRSCSHAFSDGATEARSLLEVTETGPLVGYYLVVKYTPMNEWRYSCRAHVVDGCTLGVCGWGRTGCPRHRTERHMAAPSIVGIPSRHWIGPYQLFRIPFVDSKCVFNRAFNNQLESCMPATVLSLSAVASFPKRKMCVWSVCVCERERKRESIKARQTRRAAALAAAIFNLASGQAPQQSRAEPSAVEHRWRKTREDEKKSR